MYVIYLTTRSSQLINQLLTSDSHCRNVHNNELTHELCGAKSIPKNNINQYSFGQNPLPKLENLENLSQKNLQLQLQLFIMTAGGSIDLMSKVIKVKVKFWSPYYFIMPSLLGTIIGLVPDW